MIKDMKKNPGEHLEELLSHMETNDCEQKGTKVEDFHLAQRKSFNGIKDNFNDNIIAQIKERFPEKDIQVLQDLNTILNPAKLPGTAAGIWNHGTKILERLVERYADASEEESVIDADEPRNSFIQFKHFLNSNKDKPLHELCEILAKPGVYKDILPLLLF